MNWIGAFGKVFQEIRPRPTDSGSPERRRPSVCAAPAGPSRPAAAEPPRGIAGNLFLDRRVFTALKEEIVRHNARRPDWRIREVRCMPCSVTRGLGLRSISDLDGLIFYQ